MQTLPEFVDSILLKVGDLIDAHGFNKAVLIVEIGKMLISLKEGIQKEKEGNKKIHDFLKKQLEDMQRQITGSNPEVRNVYHLDLENTIAEEEIQNGSETNPS